MGQKEKGHRKKLPFINYTQIIVDWSYRRGTAAAKEKHKVLPGSTWYFSSMDLKTLGAEGGQQTLPHTEPAMYMKQSHLLSHKLLSD